MDITAGASSFESSLNGDFTANDREHERFRRNDAVHRLPESVLVTPPLAPSPDLMMVTNSSILTNDVAQEPTAAVPVDRSFVYDVDESPGFVISTILALQVALNCFGGNLVSAVVIAKVLCVKQLVQVEAELFCKMLFTSGISTWLQVTFGARLPLYQGANSGWIAAVVTLSTTAFFKCPSPSTNNSSDRLTFDNNVAALASDTVDAHREVEDTPIGYRNYSYNGINTDFQPNEWWQRYSILLGGLLGASLVQVFVGATGLVSLAMHFTGPLTVAPVLIFITFILCPVALELSAKHWGLSFLTFALVFIYSFALGKYSVPLHVRSSTTSRDDPRHGKKATTISGEAPLDTGKRLIRYPIFSVGGLFLAMVTSWIVSGIITTWLDEDSAARIDSKIGAVKTAEWFSVPWPFKYGMPTFTASTFALALIIAIASIIESLGDYMAMAAVVRAQPMPKHAINRGILLEGVGCLLGAVIGAPAPVTTYSNVTGIIMVTRVASRRILQLAGLLTAVCGILPKLGALLSSMPEPIIGGVGLATFGMIFAVGIGLLQNVDLDSPRNLAVLGASVVIGIAVPQWMALPTSREQLAFGVEGLDQCVQVLLGSSIFVGAFVGFLLDNVLPGTRRERGMDHWASNQLDIRDADSKQLARRINRVYDVPYLGNFIRRNRFMQRLPFMPNNGELQGLLFQQQQHHAANETELRQLV